MTLLHSYASMFERTPRIAATRAFVRMAGSRRSDWMGVYRPLPREHFIV